MPQMYGKNVKNGANIYRLTAVNKTVKKQEFKKLSQIQRSKPSS